MKIKSSTQLLFLLLTILLLSNPIINADPNSYGGDIHSVPSSGLGVSGNNGTNLDILNEGDKSAQDSSGEIAAETADAYAPPPSGGGSSRIKLSSPAVTPAHGTYVSAPGTCGFPTPAPMPFSGATVGVYIDGVLAPHIVSVLLYIDGTPEGMARTVGFPTLTTSMGPNYPGVPPAFPPGPAKTITATVTACKGPGPTCTGEVVTDVLRTPADDADYTFYYHCTPP